MSGDEKAEGERLGLSDCLRSLDDFAAGRPVRQPDVGAAIATLGLGDRERREWRDGGSRLWSLVPPIELAALAEAELDPAELRAAAVAVVVWGVARASRSSGRGGDPIAAEDVREVEAIARWLLDEGQKVDLGQARGGVEHLRRWRDGLRERRLQRAAERAGDAPSGPYRLVPERAPGLGERLRQILRPSGPSERPAAPDPAEQHVDPVVPPMLPWPEYLRLSAEWAAGKRVEPGFLQGLFDGLFLAAPARACIASQAERLKSVSADRSAASLIEAGLDPGSAEAAAVGLISAARHAMARYLPVGAPAAALIEAAEVLGFVELQIEGKPDLDPQIRALLAAQIDALRARGIVVGARGLREGVTAAKVAAAEQRRAVEAEAAARPAPTTGRGSWVAAGLAAVLVLSAAVVLVPRPRSPFPPASAYTELPVAGLVRLGDRVQVRVHPSWLSVPEPARATAASALLAHLTQESQGAVQRLELEMLDGAPLGSVSPAGVRWAPALPPR